MTGKGKTEKVMTGKGKTGKGMTGKGMTDRAGAAKAAFVQPGSPKRSAILAAGLALFAERGYHGTTIPEIAATAGVGAGTFYRYFDGKDVLVNELYRSWKRTYSGFLLGNMKPGNSVPAARAMFRETWQRMRTFATEHPQVVDFLELHRHSSYLDEESRELERTILARVMGFIVEAQNANAIRRISPPVVMSLLWGAFYGLFRAVADGYIKADPKIYDEAEAAIWESVRL